MFEKQKNRNTNKFMFLTEEILQIIKKVESINATKCAHKWPQKRPVQAVLDNKEKKY